MRCTVGFVILPLVLVVSMLVTLPVHARLYTNQADIKVENSATSDGIIQFKFTPKGGRSEEIVVSLEAGWDEERVARQIEVVFGRTIGANYKVSWNNKRKVTITKRGGKKRFFLGLSRCTSKGVTVGVDYD